MNQKELCKVCSLEGIGTEEAVISPVPWLWVDFLPRTRSFAVWPHADQFPSLNLFPHL